MLERSFSGFSCPVMKVTAEDRSLWVSGIPAYAGAAIAEVTPGTISNSMPAEASSSASSPPLAEYERVSALEPHDGLALSGLFL